MRIVTNLAPVLRALLLATLAPSVMACGPQFDPPHEVKSLRVLGIKKDKPYAQPADTVELSMLWHDPEAAPGRLVTKVWFAGCTNPPGDLYQGCFAQFAAIGDALAGGAPPPGVMFGFEDTFSFQIPADILTTRPPPPDPSQPHYGLSYVFFALCAGQFAQAPPEEAGSFPIRCLDADGTPLTPDDFVVGYTAIYTFSGFTNANPVISAFTPDGGGFEFRGRRLAEDCAGAACQGAPERSIDCSSPADADRCIPPCADDGEPSCPEHPLRAIADPTSAEPDTVSMAAYKRDVQEQMWLNYYVDHGALRSGVKLLNDATTGWNEAHGTDFFAPKDPGLVQVWAVAHDNRGGTDFARFSLKVE